MPPSIYILHRCPNGEVPRAVDRHEISLPEPKHTVAILEAGQMPLCLDCGARHVFTLYGALALARDGNVQEIAESIPSPEREMLLDGIVRLERYALQRWGRGLDLQTIEDIPRELCKLRGDLRPSIPGLGTYDDLDAAYAMPLSEAVVTLADLRPCEEAETSPANTERYFMELAIHEARKSVGEKGRANPKVGAVVVRTGVVLATAHRGELGKGDHAEFTALEKKLPNETLVGATIYTTLEPCTTRNHPKVPCSMRIIERKIARVLIGMLDPNPSICGRGERLLREHGIEVDRFPDNLIVRLEELNRDFTRAHGSR